MLASGGGRAAALPVSIMFLLFIAPRRAAADHGPGTSGGASTIQSGETMREGALSLSLRWDFTRFEKLSDAGIERRTRKVDDDHAHVDALRFSSLVTVELSYGLSERFQLGLSTGWYRGDDLREGHLHGDGSYGFHEFGDVTGMTDLWINGKLRLYRGPYGRWAGYGGVKLPTGQDDVRGEGEEEPLEASLQPGSGAFDFQVGTAYSIWLTERITLDASGQYIFRTENDGFKIGDRIDGGVAVAYRLMEDMQRYPQVSLFTEVVLRYIFRNREDGDMVENSGGAVLFLAPGIRTAFSERVSLTVSPRFPVLQELNDEQQETSYQIGSDLTLTF